jgi:hypothetical protein
MKPVFVIVGFLAVALAASPAAAQSTGSFELTPFVGTFVPRSAVGPAAPAGATWFLRLERVDPTVSLGASVLAKWTPQIAARLTLQSVLPSYADGTFACRPGTVCPAVLLQSRTRVSSQIALADLVVAPLRGQTSVRPFLSAGGGLRRDHYRWADAEVLLGGGSHSAIGFTGRAGAGVEIDLRRSALRVEIEHFWTPGGAPLYDAPLDAPAIEHDTTGPNRRAQRDLGVRIAWRLLPF